ncbi:MAG: hypothetical protein HAW60_02500 [Bdellovibrionales bacterium]|nr:hypothetical protein [Bdellovibrionales bacterium]
MFKKYFYVISISVLFSVQSFTFADASIRKYNGNNPFSELQHLFSVGDDHFSFNLNTQNWYSGRCFAPYSSSPSASLLFLLPGDFYKDRADRGPLFPGSKRMWILGSDKQNANEFDTINSKKENDILKILKNDPAPGIERFSNSLVSRWNSRGTGIALRNSNNYLIVQKFSLYNNFVSEYCYYFKKVK